jgi:hypothetical protein
MHHLLVLSVNALGAALSGDSKQLSVNGKGEFAKVTPSSTEKPRGPTLVGGHR